MQKTQKGFIALLSSIILSAILLVTTTSLSLSSFFTRFTIVESEYKARSTALAEACVDSAIIKIALDSNYSPTDEKVHIDNDECLITKIVANGPQKTIYTQANYQKSYTNLSVTIKTSDLEIISWIENPD